MYYCPELGSWFCVVCNHVAGYEHKEHQFWAYTLPEQKESNTALKTEDTGQ